MAPPRRFRLRFVDLQLSKWRRPGWFRLSLPDAVRLKRLAAPLCVFIFGMIKPLNSTHYSAPVAFGKHAYVRQIRKGVQTLCEKY